jgi:hypothetical protein
MADPARLAVSSVGALGFESEPTYFEEDIMDELQTKPFGSLDALGFLYSLQCSSLLKLKMSSLACQP